MGISLETLLSKAEYMPLDEESIFYDRFKLLCDKKGVSVSRACLEMGLSRSIAAKWKCTNTKPSADVLPKIAKYFGMTVDSLIGAPTLPEKDEAAAEEASAAARLSRKIPNWPDLTEENKARLLDYAALLLKSQQDE